MLTKSLFVLGALLALGGPSVAILGKERLLKSGRSVLLELAPVDPRSLMQGDYMALNYAVGRAAMSRQDGRLVLQDDPRGVAQVVRTDDGGPLRPGEYLLRYRCRRWGIRICGDSYFFQEGTGSAYAHARYGELRVGPDGDGVLVGLRDEAKQPLGSFR